MADNPQQPQRPLRSWNDVEWRKDGYQPFDPNKPNYPDPTVRPTAEVLIEAWGHLLPPQLRQKQGGQ